MAQVAAANARTAAMKDELEREIARSNLHSPQELPFLSEEQLNDEAHKVIMEHGCTRVA